MATLKRAKLQDCFNVWKAVKKLRDSDVMRRFEVSVILYTLEHKLGYPWPSKFEFVF